MRALEVWNTPAEVESNFEDIEALAAECKLCIPGKVTAGSGAR
jgi:hypothetical protein